MNFSHITVLESKAIIETTEKDKKVLINNLITVFKKTRDFWNYAYCITEYDYGSNGIEFDISLIAINKYQRIYHQGGYVSIYHAYDDLIQYIPELNNEINETFIDAWMFRQ